MNKNYLDVLDSAANLRISDNLDLFPSVAERINQRKAFMQTLRARPGLAVMLAILALLLLTGVAYAIGRLAGYIPGVGIVDQSEPLRVLAEPVTVTRDGITLTVEQVVLSADKTVLLYKVEGISENAYPSDENTEDLPSSSYSSVITTEETPQVSESIVEAGSSCVPDDHLRLPNGSTLGIRSSQGSGWTTGFENQLVYPPISKDTNEVTFLVSCISGTLPEALPQNWEIHLRLIPASSDLTILPVVNAPAIAGQLSAMTLEQVIETDNGYILIGKFRSIGLPAHAQAQGGPSFVLITDANGQAVDAAPARDLDPNNVFGEFVWGYEIKGKKQAWPLTLTMDTVQVLYYEQTTDFQFDTGPNPQTGQKWILNQDIQFEGYTIRVVSIERTSSGYSFVFKADPHVVGITAEIKDFPPVGGNGGDGGFGTGDLYSTTEYNGEPPSGKLTIELGWLHAYVAGSWRVQWSPDNVLPAP